MNKKIRLIWEFRGPGAERTAAHHIIHLKEYVALEKLSFGETMTETVSEFKAFAYLIINADDLDKTKEDLKPHRGQYYNTP